MKNYVIINAIPVKQGKILLIEKQKPDWQKGYLNLCGGHIEEGETPQEAAIRELKEEAGYIPDGDFYECGLILGEKEVVYCWNIYVDETMPPEPREEELEKVRWYPWLHAKNDKRLIPSLRLVYPMMMSGIKGWKVFVKETFMDKKSHKVEIEIPSNLSYAENQQVSNILGGK